MGFFNGFMKVLQGKPVFEAPENKLGEEEVASSVAANQKKVVPQSSAKSIPEVTFDHCKSHIDGSEMEVTVWVTNTSAVEVELDKITMLGKTTELDRILMPNQGYEATLYKGEVAKSDDDEMAHLQYKQRKNGDYFRADFTLEFNYDAKGFYEVEEFHPVSPVTDI